MHKPPIPPSPPRVPGLALPGTYSICFLNISKFVWLMCPHCKFKRVVLTRGSHFNTIIRKVIFSPHFSHNVSFSTLTPMLGQNDTLMPKRSRNDSNSM